MHPNKGEGTACGRIKTEYFSGQNAHQSAGDDGSHICLVVAQVSHMQRPSLQQSRRDIDNTNRHPSLLSLLELLVASIEMVKSDPPQLVT